MSNLVLVIDINRKPLTPCKPGTARRLLNAGKAAVFRQYPFTIILKKEVSETPEPCQLKLDPGSKTTGFAILQGAKVLWGAELSHRGMAISLSLASRKALRSNRRCRKTRSRRCRGEHNTKPKGWLAPSLMHRVHGIETWVKKLIKFCPIDSIAMELVRFDTQAINNPEISGAEYQQGTLFQYETREYLLEKWGRKCAYCGAENTPLEVEHIAPRSKGGSNRVSNLAIACVPCNQAKSNRSIEEFLSGKPDLLNRIKTQAKRPLRDAAAVNSTRWKLFNTLKEMGLPVSVGTGGQTKFNRSQQGIPKAHWLDAACVGETPTLEICTDQPLLIKAIGRGTRQAIQVYGNNKDGTPISGLPWPSAPGMQKRNKKGELVRRTAENPIVKGFQSGDIVKAVVPEHLKKKGVHVGAVSVRTSGSFNIKTLAGTVQGINHKYCSFIHRKDGYSYAF